MAAPSEQISMKWIEGAERICVSCRTPITNLAKQVGEVRSYYKGGHEMTRLIFCMNCPPGGRGG